MIEKNCYKLIQKYLPHYAVPKFIRFKKEFEFTATHKIQKINLKNEGYNPNVLKDPLFILLPESSEYIPLTKDIYQNITEGKYRF